MKTLRIEKGWFFGAGSPKMYNWKHDGFDIYGVGIALDFLKDTTEVEVVVNNIPYILNTHQAVDFAKRYNSVEVRNGTRLIVVSRTLFSPVQVLPTVDL